MPRSPYPPPRHPDGDATVCLSPNKITFLHPGYGRDAQPLLILSACDENDTVDHEIARVACAIIACNSFQGYITTDVQGKCRVSGSQLPFIEDGYFFQVPRQDESNHPYPVYPSFRHWSPPPVAELPSHWKDCPILASTSLSGRLTSVTAHNIIQRDGTCRITNYTEKTEGAHIIPDGESEWFHSRGLIRRASLADESNSLLLKTDVHQLWDQRHFVIVPRLVEQEHEKVIQWFTYVFKRQPFQEVISLYHDVRLQPLFGIDVLFLFCRFAWTIFESLDIFLDQGSERWLMVRNPLTCVEEVAKFTAAKCQDKIFTRRGRSQSPKRNKRTASNAGEADDRFDYSGSPSSLGRSGSSDEEVERGRKRSRRESSCDSSWYAPRSFVSSATEITTNPDDESLNKEESGLKQEESELKQKGSVLDNALAKNNKLCSNSVNHDYSPSY